MKIPLLILMAALISIFLTSNTIIASEKTKQNNQHDQESKTIPHAAKKSEILQKNKLWLESFTGINFVPIPGGMFEIGDQFEEGDQDEKETRNVMIKPFFLGQTEITQSQWKRVMGSNPSRFKGDNNPVEKISIYEVMQFIDRLNKRYQGKTVFRLPTEAEWEYACKEGGKKRRFCHGKNTAGQAEIHYGKHKTAPVASYPPNALGLYDMSGNVWEWTCSEYAKFFNGKEEKCSKNLIKNNTVRGGSWGSQQRGVRASNRNVIFGGYGPADADSHRGFRLARD